VRSDREGCEGEKKMKITRSVLVVAAFLAISCVGLAWLIAGDPISQRNWDRIHKGMTKTQVIAILGEPNSYDGNQLEYSRFLNVGWVEFDFNEKEVLIEKNDESAFRSLD
jgi:hypothetical protein